MHAMRAGRGGIAAKPLPFALLVVKFSTDCVPGKVFHRARVCFKTDSLAFRAVSCGPPCFGWICAHAHGGLLQLLALILLP